MAELINIILQKPEWKTKIDNNTIVETWRTEVEAQGINSKVFSCVLELLKSYKTVAAQSDYEGEDMYDWDVRLGVNPSEAGISCSCKCAVCEDGYNEGESEYDDDDEEDEEDEYKKRRKVPCQCSAELRETRFHAFLSKFVLSKTMEDAALKNTLIQHITDFERSLTAVDYHPGSNNQVIDLVHPSLFCYVKGVTQTQPGPNNEPAPATDAVFQWLPSEFTVNRDSENNVQSVSIDSYINNLPRDGNEGLYSSISSVFGQLVPQFDQVLEALHVDERLKRPDSAPKSLSHCQVIVKLANIVIAPGEDASFPGGHWHLEGMRTERIAATGIYYYDMTNVQANTLKFRSTVEDSCDIDYPQNGETAVTRHYGMYPKDDGDREYETQMELGEVATTEDKLLVFPNFLQHKVSDFTLIDNTKPGSRKILCFFLINPYEQIISTAHVAPQQTNGAMTLEEAQMYRELLMFQRKYEIDDQTSYFERGWSLCEH